MKKVFVAAAAALSVAAAATSTVVMSTGSAGASSAGAQFTADRNVLGAASSAFDQAFTAWEKSGNSIAQTSSFADAYISALETEDHTLLNQGWPAGAIADIDAVVRGDAAVEGVVATLPGLPSSSSETDWFIAFNQDAAVGVADANIVRHDLGLPLKSFS
ncbi:MAG TPA: hypothetical protein VME20_07315 [Acidimicrobiales bacterium]|nr:hypothetical protein [Acidimicrobiales bacterium]